MKGDLCSGARNQILMKGSGDPGHLENEQSENLIRLRESGS
jgi:hypothetical protein